jgi:predicted GNAT family N-acyltransferase
MNIELGDWARLGQEASTIRRTVFIEEQGVPPELEWDEALDQVCLHVLARIDGQAVGTARLLPDAHIGRMAVLPAFRRHRIGSALLMALVQAARARGEPAVELSAQTYVRAFYARHGFEAYGPLYDDAGIEHQMMRLELG